MIFSSYRFLFGFLPVVLLGYHLLRLGGRPLPVKLWLIAASLTFYGLGQPDFLGMFVLSILLNYGIVCGLQLYKAKWGRRLLLLAAIGWNIGLLIYFKYTNFLLENLNLLLGTDYPLISVILPIGISFFTFQILAYTISFYRGESELVSPVDYLLFITFFPQLIVGPVVKEEELVPQLRGRRLLRFRKVSVYRAVQLFSYGCAKKILLAGPLISYASEFYGGTVSDFSTAEAWMGVLCYTFAYYFDFSGYIDMARGLGYCFGVELPINFDSPYKSRDFADFWRRWNITISRFFNESVFNNLFHFGDGIPKLILATMLTFLVSGIWHGAGWHYIVWGLANGVLVCIANIRVLKMRKPLPAGLAVGLTFFFSALIRVLFDSGDMLQAVQVYLKLFDPAAWSHPAALGAAFWSFVQSRPVLTATLIISALVTFCLPNSNRVSEQKRFRLGEAILCGVLLALSLCNMTQVSTFLYFNF